MLKVPSGACILNARRSGTVIPAFNIPYLPMMQPVVAALRDADSFGFIAVARLEWIKFESRSMRAVFEEYQRTKDERFTRLHLDHVPVIDEDDIRVDFEAVIEEALRTGYDSVMVDGSRLTLEENIRATKAIVEIAHRTGTPVEGELGAVLGHESGPLPLYEELYSTGRGFTDPDQAKRFAGETGVDWLSVAVGNVHGAISAVSRRKEKVEARLNIPRLRRIRQMTAVPLVLHGGTGIRKEYLKDAFQSGIAKINIATAIRQPYEENIAKSVAVAQQAVYDSALRLLTEELDLRGSRRTINPEFS